MIAAVVWMDGRKCFGVVATVKPKIKNMQYLAVAVFDYGRND